MRTVLFLNRYIFIFLMIICSDCFGFKKSLNFKVDHQNCYSIYSRLHKWVEIEDQVKFLLNLIPQSLSKFHKQNCCQMTQFQISNIRNQTQKVLHLIEYENSLTLPFGNDHKQVVPILKQAKNIMYKTINSCETVSINMINRLLHLTTCLINHNRCPVQVRVSGTNCKKKNYSQMKKQFNLK